MAEYVRPRGHLKIWLAQLYKGGPALSLGSHAYASPSRRTVSSSPVHHSLLLTTAPTPRGFLPQSGTRSIASHTDALFPLSRQPPEPLSDSAPHGQQRTTDMLSLPHQSKFLSSDPTMTILPTSLRTSYPASHFIPTATSFYQEAPEQASAMPVIFPAPTADSAPF